MTTINDVADLITIVYNQTMSKNNTAHWHLFRKKAVELIALIQHKHPKKNMVNRHGEYRDLIDVSEQLSDEAQVEFNQLFDWLKTTAFGIRSISQFHGYPRM